MSTSPRGNLGVSAQYLKMRVVHLGRSTCHAISGRGASAVLSENTGGPSITVHCSANVAHIRQSRPDSGPGFQDLSGRGTTRAEDAQGTPTRSHISPSILVYEDKSFSVHPSSLGSGPAWAPRRSRRFFFFFITLTPRVG